MLVKQVVEYKSVENEYNELAAYTTAASGKSNGLGDSEATSEKIIKENKNSGLKILSRIRHNSDYTEENTMPKFLLVAWYMNLFINSSA